jgi:hypothetical protein
MKSRAPYPDWSSLTWVSLSNHSLGHGEGSSWSIVWEHIWSELGLLSRSFLERNRIRFLVQKLRVYTSEAFGRPTRSINFVADALCWSKGRRSLTGWQVVRQIVAIDLIILQSEPHMTHGHVSEWYATLNRSRRSRNVHAFMQSSTVDDESVQERTLSLREARFGLQGWCHMGAHKSSTAGSRGRLGWASMVPCAPSTASWCEGVCSCRS